MARFPGGKTVGIFHLSLRVMKSVVSLSVFLITAVVAVTTTSTGQEITDLREWNLSNGETAYLKLENAYGDSAYMSDSEGNPLTGLITVFAEAEQADIVNWSRLRDEAMVEGGGKPSKLTRQFRKDARQLVQGELEKVDWSGKTEPEFYAIYSSASGSEPCREFTPELVQFYDTFKPATEGRFEVLLCSWDDTEADMIQYMEEEDMEWYGTFRLGKSRFWRKFQGEGVPCLVVVDRNGFVISHSYRMEEYVGPDEVLSDLSRLLACTNPGSDGRLSVPPPGVDMDKLRDGIAQLQDQARTENRNLPASLVLSPQSMIVAMQDPDAPQIQIKLKVSISALGIVKKVEAVDEAYRHLEEPFYKAMLLWQFLPAVDKYGSVHDSSVIIPLKLRLRADLK